MTLGAIKERLDPAEVMIRRTSDLGTASQGQASNQHLPGENPMTIAASYLTSEGVVFGADSATSVSLRGVPGVLQVFNHAQKIFEVGPPGQGRMALVTWGAGSASQVSHRTIAARLSDKITNETSVENAAEILKQLVGESGTSDEFGYFLGGTDLPSRTSACYQLLFKPGHVEQSQQKVGQGKFEGAPELFHRAYHGCDPEFLRHVFATLKSRVGDRVPELEEIFNQAIHSALDKIPHGGFPDLPIREAIDFVHMYLHLTIKGIKFRFGPPACGGPIEIAFISTDRPFRWVRHKSFDTAIFEEEVGEL
jgi:hypothetical protein